MEHSSRKPEYQPRQPLLSVLGSHQTASSHLQPLFSTTLTSLSQLPRHSSRQPAPQAFPLPQPSPESQPLCGPTTTPFRSIPPHDASPPTGGRASPRSGRPLLHQLFQVQIPPGRFLLRLGGVQDAEGGVLVRYYVILVLRVGRLMVKGHVDHFVWQLGRAIKFLEDISEVGFVHVHVGVRGVFGHVQFTVPSGG